MRNNLSFLFLLFVLNIQAQEISTTDYSHLPDKVYLHLDRNLYAPGDTIWAKAYVFHRNNLALSDNSFSLHLQVLSQEGKEVSNYKMLIVDGMGYGQIPIYDTMKPGFYQIIAHTGYMKNFGQQFFYKKTVEIGRSNAQISIKTFFNKSQYTVGDTAKVTFQAYDEYQIPLPKMRFCFELSHAGEVLEKGWLKCYEDGTASALLPITAGTKANPAVLKLSYLERASDEKNTETKLFVPMKDEKVVVQFFPEGGNSIQGMMSKVAFEATDALGEPIALKGVLQENGKPIFEAKTIHEGMGFFTFLPLDAKYTFKIIQPEGIDSIFSLPEVMKDGYTISYLKQDKENLYLQVAHNYTDAKNIGLWVSQYDKLLKVYDLNVESSRMFTLSKQNLPKGTVTFTITDDKNRPQAERLIYLTSEEKKIHISTQEDIYSQRKKVIVNLSIDNPDTTAHLSVAVVDSVMATSPWLDVDNIKAYTFLGSELRGKIAHINQYLKHDRMAEYHRNLLMMTHGWRRYSWIYNKQHMDTMRVIDFNYMDGQVMRFKKPQANAKLTAMVVGDFSSFSEFSADEDGRFRIKLKYEDRENQKILIQAESEKGSKNVKIVLQNIDTLLFNSIVKSNSDNLKPQYLDANRYVKEDEEDKKPFMSYETKMLKELVVYGEQDRSDSEDLYYDAMKSSAAGSISGDELVGGYSFADYIRQASYRADYNSSTGRFVVKSRGGGANSPFGNTTTDERDVGASIYVNGIYWGKDVNDLDFLTKEEVVEIVVLDSEGAYASHGTEGQYGVILVRTTPLNLTRENSLNHNMAIFGRFIDSKEFYQPVYETKTQDSLVVVDNRITLHWVPFVETDENGKAVFDFYTDDISGVKQIVVQGMDDKGNLFYQTHEFNVEVVGP